MMYISQIFLEKQLVKFIVLHVRKILLNLHHTPLELELVLCAQNTSTEGIKFHLRLRTDSFRVYLKNTIQLAERHNIEMSLELLIFQIVFTSPCSYLWAIFCDWRHVILSHIFYGIFSFYHKWISHPITHIISWGG